MWIGRRIPLREGREKVSGRLRFAADLGVPDLLHARLVLSPVAHGRIRRIGTDRALAVPGVVAVLTARDLPWFQGTPYSHATGLLARERVVYAGQPVAVVLGEREVAAEDAAALVEVEVDPLPAVVDPLEALAEEAPPVWPEGIPGLRADAGAHAAGAEEPAAQTPRGSPNVAARVRFARGDVARGLGEADLVLERTYRTASVHQGYLEPHATVAIPDPGGEALTLWTGTQSPFGVRQEVARFLGWPEHRVRVVPAPVGGGFGGKFLLLETLAAALAVHTRRPVRIVLTRHEEFLLSNPVHGAILTLRTGVRRDGSLTALQARLVFDAGAFPGSPARIAAFLLGAIYRFPHLEIEAFEVLTHKPGTGAYRAPGSPQAAFALESQMDEMSRQLGLDPLEFRLQNLLQEGDALPDGRRYPRIGLRACLLAIQEHPLWREGRRTPGEGLGLAVGGWPGGLEPAAAACSVDRDGSVRVHVGAVDLQGTHTALGQLVAEILGVPPERVRIVQGDTDHAPYAGASAGSKVLYTVGRAVQYAAEEARARILRMAAQVLEAAVEDLELRDGYVFVRGVSEPRVSLAELAGLAQRFGGRFEPIWAVGTSAQTEQAPAFAAQLVRVRVDPETGQVRVLDAVLAQDVGCAINPLLIEGQVYGGMVQGLGWGLWEAIFYDRSGIPRTTSFLDYALPRATTIPSMQGVLVEVPSPHGPFGARGVGEPPVVPGAGAVANAIRDAVGARVLELPITPERVLRALRGF
ncbi:MAG: xanthine dehydrogenase family protein molybdopterin-binding subunit [Armatimonadetes bacterium]|nr:xanthine dehydrogenase family protein molybdopterin-binding subunit [Armatimonadota bacterium]MDW8152714.1 xanthine dehydrogenase family protein molybdopterin-binding subunit [Armatimonadota bacterium]